MLHALLAAIVGAAGVLVLPGTVSAAPAKNLYLVQVDGAPVASYEGGVAGLPATKPRAGGKLDKRAWGYEAYQRHLRTGRDRVMRAAGVDPDRAVAEYSTAFNGFAVALTVAEKRAVERADGVVRVWKNEIHTVDTVGTPDFLGLTGSRGVWQTRFGDPTRAGEGVVVGVIDTGFWPEHPSLATMPEPPGGRPDQAAIHAKWYADGVDKCDEGTGGAAERITCNNKVIGARWYNASGLGGWDAEYTSPRDYDGHGTHTATTAAGLHAVPATINGDDVGRTSGVAPAARLAVYKALWRQADGDSSGGTVDLMQAVDDAVTDGVDVINYSVSGSSAYIVDPIELAFFNAAAAGVFVAASAGNSGPDASTVAHNAPWTTTVAASTHDRGATKSLTLGNGVTYRGAGQGPALPASPLADAAASGPDPARAELCYPGSLDPAKVTGSIVLCRRGANARTDKSVAVRDAGGIGMILYNPTVNSINGDYHVVPTVHVGPVEGAAIKAYLADAASPTASLSAVSTFVARAPAMGAFSSTGPAVAGGGDLLKPDLTAPGIDVIAGVSPSGHHGNLFDAASGTSMSSPHVAGIAALLRAAHPTWSPTAIRSALMTTADVHDSSGAPLERDGKPATPLDHGAGHVRPLRAFDPGLVYESTPRDWIRYGCGIGQFQLVSSWCSTVGSADPSDLNYPSIAIGDLPGKQTVKRTVTNVGSTSSVYAVSVSAPAGFRVSVSPTVLTVAPGRSATYQVRFERTDAAYDTWSFGSLTWTDLRGHAVRSPLAVRPVALSGPGSLSGTGSSGRASISLRAGYAGTVSARTYGLAPSTVFDAELTGSDTGFDPDEPAASASVLRFTANVPPDAKVARFATFAADHAPGTDLDLYVYRSGTLIDAGVGSTADEEVTLTESGDYEVYVVQFAVPSGIAGQAVRAHTFVVGASSAGNLDVRPGRQHVKPDEVVTFAVAWHGLDPARRYLGTIEFRDGSSVRARTLVSVAP